MKGFVRVIILNHLEARGTVVLGEFFGWLGNTIKDLLKGLFFTVGPILAVVIGFYLIILWLGLWCIIVAILCSGLYSTGMGLILLVTGSVPNGGDLSSSPLYFLLGDNPRVYGLVELFIGLVFTFASLFIFFLKHKHEWRIFFFLD